MFSNVQRGVTGLGALVTVAAVIAIYFATVGVMWLSWQEAGTQSAGCAMVCAKPAVTHGNG